MALSTSSRPISTAGLKYGSAKASARRAVSWERSSSTMAMVALTTSSLTPLATSTTAAEKA